MKRRRASGPRFLPALQIARAAERLVREHRQRNPNFAIPFDLHELIWDHLNVVDELSLDEETPLGFDPRTGEKIWGKTLAEERLIMIDPSVQRMPFYRFTLAHEIGHWVLHCRPGLRRRSLTDRIREKQGLSLTASSASLRPGGENRREIQANLFASCLLMPEADVRREAASRLDDSIQFPERAPTEKDLIRLAEAIAQKRGPNGEPSLRELFDVSIETMAVRLRALKLIQPAPGAIATI